MPYCGKCGKETPAESQFCSHCGAPLQATAGAASPDPDQPFDPADVAENKVIAALTGLFPILFFLPLVARPNSRFCRAYVNPSLILLIASFASGILAVIPIIGWIASAVVGIYIFVCCILNLVHALDGTFKPLPILGNIELIK